MNGSGEQGPEELRREIARTRADMDRTLAALEDRVSPSRIRERQAERMRTRWRRTREAVMGSPDDGPGMRERMSGAADEATGMVQEAPQRAEELTRGNPLAAGLVAFGVGALAGSLVPSSRTEQALASELRMEFEEPVRAELREAGQQVSSELQDHARDAMEETQRTAQEGMERTQDQARSSAEEVRDHARDSARTVRGD